MSQKTDDKGRALSVAQMVPYIRRYARALTGSQDRGDLLTNEGLVRALAAADDFADADDQRLTMFKHVHSAWVDQGRTASLDDANGLEASAQAHLSKLDLNSREALLLEVLDGFSVDQIAEILTLDAASVERLLKKARDDIAGFIKGRILVIEDDSVIALDLQSLAKDLGHDVIGTAENYEKAVSLGRANPPDLILADIKLTDDRTGIEAVVALMNELGEIPTIFVTAYPELYLKGNRPEPAFLISKPYTEDQIRTAIGQAMFFSSAAVLDNVV